MLSEWQGEKVNDSSRKQRMLQPEDILEAILIPLVHLRDEENEDQIDILMFVKPVNYRDGIRNPVFHSQSSVRIEERNLCHALPSNISLRETNLLSNVPGCVLS